MSFISLKVDKVVYFDKLETTSNLCLFDGLANKVTSYKNSAFMFETKDRYKFFQKSVNKIS